MLILHILQDKNWTPDHKVGFKIFTTHFGVKTWPGKTIIILMYKQTGFCSVWPFFKVV